MARGGFRGRGAPLGRGGVPGGARTHFSADKNLYVHLVNYLKKQSLLPVVVFTFSKRRCEENAATLTNVDLATASERSEVHIAIEKALARLKGNVGYTCAWSDVMNKVRFGQKIASNW